MPSVSSYANITTLLQWLCRSQNMRRKQPPLR